MHFTGTKFSQSLSGVFGCCLLCDGGSVVIDLFILFVGVVFGSWFALQYSLHFVVLQSSPKGRESLKL